MIARGQMPVAKLVPLENRHERRLGVLKDFMSEEAIEALVTALDEPLSSRDQAPTDFGGGAGPATSGNCVRFQRSGPYVAAPVTCGEPGLGPWRSMGPNPACSGHTGEHEVGLRRQDIRRTDERASLAAIGLSICHIVHFAETATLTSTPPRA